MTIYSTGAKDLPAIADRNRNSMTLQAGVGNNPLHVWDGVHAGMIIKKTTGMGFAIGPGRGAVNCATLSDGTLSAVITADEPGAFEPNETAAIRKDLVVLRSYPENPSETGVQVEVIKGVTGSVSRPMPPAGTIALFEVEISAGMTAANGGWNPTKVTDRRRLIGVPEFVHYTPTWVGFDNLGSNPNIWGKYRLDGGKCTVHVHHEGGVGASMGDYHMLAFTLPIPAKGGFVYSGTGSLHHPNVTGLAYGLQILTAGDMGMVWKPNEYGALVQPGRIVAGSRYPWEKGTVMFCSVEYDIDEAWQLSLGSSGA